MRGKKNNWACFLLILAGIVLGGLIGNLFDSSWLNYGQTFGFVNPLELDLGILIVKFAFQIKITIASVLGIVIGIIIYRLI